MGDHVVLYVDHLIDPSSGPVAPAVGCGEEKGEKEMVVVEEEEPLIQMFECRICQEEDHIKNLETPCVCSGSLKYAHRDCVQRWCNEKGDIICEICHETYKPDYTAPLRPPPDETTIDITGAWTITGAPVDLRDPRILAMATAQRHFLEAEYDEYAATNSSGAAFCRSAALILMALLLLRHALSITTDGDEDPSTYFSLFLLRAAGFLLPCYIMAWAISILHQRRQRQEAAALAAAEGARPCIPSPTFLLPQQRTYRKREIAMKLYLLLIFFLSLAPFSVSSPKKKAPPSAARKEDIPFIKCQVCNKIAHQIYNQVKGKESKISPKKISEYEVIEIAENVCNLKKTEADWILQIDIVEKGDKLELVEQGVEGHCNSECKTVERACQEVMGYSDTDVAEFVFSSKPSLDSLVNFLCNDLSKACAVKAPPIPKGRMPGEPFVIKPTKDAEMDKILRSMEGMPGAPSMKMYSREDLMNNNEEHDDDDDDDDDDDFGKNLKKILNQKSTPKHDFKEKILQGVIETGNTIKGHVKNVSGKIWNWWKRWKAGSKASESSKQEL